MIEHTKKRPEELVSCDICLKEIPVSEAKNDEASDYVRHFCGVDCYDKWKHQVKSDENKVKK